MPVGDRLSLYSGWPIWSDLVTALMEPLLSGSSLTEATWLRAVGAQPTPLNRHGVVHGIDQDYGTESNSLRATMLIGYLVMVSHLLPPLGYGR